MAEIKTVTCEVCRGSFTFENYSGVDEQIESELREHFRYHTKVDLIEALLKRFKKSDRVVPKSD